MTTVQPEKFAVGDTVVIDPAYATSKDAGQVFRVAKVPQGARGVNYHVKPIGAGVPLRAPGYMLVSATPEQIERAEARAPKGERAVVGSVVKINHPKAGDKHYVVTAVKRDGTYSAALLGGDDGRFWPSLPSALIEVVDPSTITFT